MPNQPDPLHTVAEISRQLGVPPHRIEYVIRSRRIRPVRRAGNARLFDDAAIDEVRGCLSVIDARREPFPLRAEGHKTTSVTSSGGAVQ